jgi:hypothetical protein
MAGEEHSSRIPILDAAHEDTGKIRSVFDARLPATSCQRESKCLLPGRPPPFYATTCTSGSIATECWLRYNISKCAEIRRH